MGDKQGHCSSRLSASQNESDQQDTVRAQVQATQDMRVIFNAIHEKTWKKDLRTQYSISEKSSSGYCQKDRLSILRTCPDTFLGFLGTISDKNGFKTSFPGLLLLRVKLRFTANFCYCGRTPFVPQTVTCSCP